MAVVNGPLSVVMVCLSAAAMNHDGIELEAGDSKPWLDPAVLKGGVSSQQSPVRSTY